MPFLQDAYMDVGGRQRRERVVEQKTALLILRKNEQQTHSTLIRHSGYQSYSPITFASHLLASKLFNLSASKFIPFLVSSARCRIGSINPRFSLLLNSLTLLRITSSSPADIS